MKFVVENWVVMKVQEIDTGTQIAIVKTFHDMQYHTFLSIDEDYVYVSIRDWEGNDGVEFNETIEISINGEIKEISIVDGEGNLDLSSLPNGNYLIKVTSWFIKSSEIELSK